MKVPFYAAILVLLALLADRSVAHDYSVGEITVAHPYVAETPVTAKSAAGYMTIANHGAEADRLVAVRANFPSVTLHTTEVDAAGVARMRVLDALDIPAGGTVTLSPRGIHVMFMGLAAPLRGGDQVDATLVFEQAGEIPVVFTVEPRASGDGEGGAMEGGHAGMNMTH